MRLIIGLGNPGSEYEKTRHNVGWQVVDGLLAVWQGQVVAQSGSKFQAAVWSKAGTAVVAKPLTFMNKSGLTVQSLAQFYKIGPNDIWVIHDDLDLGLGSYKFHFGKGPKVHNGLLSIYESLGTDQFWHVRVGVDGRAGDRSMPGAAYVLGVFSSQEQVTLNQTMDVILKELQKKVQA